MDAIRLTEGRYETVLACEAAYAAYVASREETRRLERAWRELERRVFEFAAGRPEEAGDAIPA